MENDRNRKLKAFEFLCDNRLGVISTISYKTQAPQSSVVYYVVNGKFIYFVTPLESRKLANMNQNNDISFTIFNEMPPVELQLEGTVESVEDLDQRKYISKIYMENANKNPNTLNWPPVLKVPNESGFVFVKFTPTWFKFSDFREREGHIVEGSPDDWQ